MKSEGQGITGHLELLNDYDVSDVDISTVRLNGEVPAELHPTEVGDYDADGVTDLTIKFDRAAVMALLDIGEATLTKTGEANDTAFEGSDTIRVMGK